MRPARALPASVAAALLLACGDSTAPSGDGPDEVAAGPTIAAGTWVTCALSTAGAAYCWGTNGFGTLGNPDVPSDTGAPIPVRGSARYVTVAVNAINQTVGPYTACALQADGAADCWGSNPDGLLGPADARECLDASGVAQEAAGPCLRVPTRVAPSLRFRRITVGWAHICGITTDGTAVCWGRGAEGQLGTGGGGTATTTTPAPVAGALRFVDIAASDKFTCALTADGAAYCWGLNSTGQLGDGTTTTRSSPVRVQGTEPLAQIDPGTAHVCAATRAGTTVCWGAGGSRQLGADGPFAGSALNSLTPIPVSLPAATRAVSAGGASACALDAAGRLRCWGWNVYGQVGTADATRCGGQGTCLPSDVAPSIAFAEVNVGMIHTCGRARDGAVYCWGSNFRRNLGDGSRRDAPTPVRVTLP
jgi:alpha-tubulin suppressor-like RCC1 family protein